MIAQALACEFGLLARRGAGPLGRCLAAPWRLGAGPSDRAAAQRLGATTIAVGGSCDDAHIAVRSADLPNGTLHAIMTVLRTPPADIRGACERISQGEEAGLAT